MRRTSGIVACWGSNENGELGDGGSHDRLVPTDVAGLSDVADVAAGLFHTCARRTSESIACWGLNTSGELGTGDVDMHRAPAGVAYLDNATSISTGADGFTCALRRSGRVMCWGTNDDGELGDGTRTTAYYAPVTVDVLTDVVEITAGGTHTCARRSAGTIACWGANGAGQLGDGTETGRLTPVGVAGPP